MKGWKFALAVASCIVAMAMVGALFAGCTQLYVGGQENNNNQVSGPSGVVSPSPGAEAGGLIATIKIGAFGSCPGVSADRTIKIGCTIPITCTPKAADGTLLPPSVTGAAPTFFGVKSGSQFVRAVPWDDEPFNLNVLGVAPGHFSLRCTVKGKSNDDNGQPPWEGDVVP